MGNLSKVFGMSWDGWKMKESDWKEEITQN